MPSLMHPVIITEITHIIQHIFPRIAENKAIFWLFISTDILPNIKENSPRTTEIISKMNATL